MKMLILLILSGVTFGAKIEFTGKPAKTFSKSGQEIKVFSEAIVKTEKNGPSKKLKLTGAGIREKKILVVSADVYVLASYSDADLKQFAKNPLEAIQEGQTELLQLTLMRDLSAEKIKDSFEVSLKENGVDVDAAPIKTIFSQLLKDQKEGDVIKILSVKGKGGQETLTFDACGKIFSVSSPSLGTDFWKIWFGKPADSGLEDLQKQLS